MTQSCGACGFADGGGCGQDDGTDTFEETYARLWPAAWPESEAEEAAADSTKGVGGGCDRKTRTAWGENLLWKLKVLPTCAASEDTSV